MSTTVKRTENDNDFQRHDATRHSRAGESQDRLGQMRKDEMGSREGDRYGRQIEPEPANKIGFGGTQLDMRNNKNSERDASSSQPNLQGRYSDELGHIYNVFIVHIQGSGALYKMSGKGPHDGRCVSESVLNQNFYRVA